MDQAAFAVEAKVEETHWWFAGRRLLFASLIGSAQLRPDAKVVDIGTGTGANLRLLRDIGFHDVIGIDPSEEAMRWCAQKGLGSVRRGDIRAIPLSDSSVDLVLATDVIEHVDEETVALSEIRRILRPRGIALITVPAFQSLWGLQDERSHHYRRYRLRPFIRRLKDSGFDVEKAFYFNYLLFIPIYLARKVISAFRVKLASENELNNFLLNRLFAAIFRIDVSTAPHLRLPFGVSILAVVRRPGAQ
jgi:SAM-dependent methyltransferase